MTVTHYNRTLPEPYRTVTATVSYRTHTGPICLYVSARRQAIMPAFRASRTASLPDSESLNCFLVNHSRITASIRADSFSVDKLGSSVLHNHINQEGNLGPALNDDGSFARSFHHCHQTLQQDLTSPSMSQHKIVFLSLSLFAEQKET